MVGDVPYIESDHVQDDVPYQVEEMSHVNEVVEVESISGLQDLRVTSLATEYKPFLFPGQTIEVSKGSVEGVQIEYIDISPWPFVNTDLEGDESYPPEVEALRHKILAADSLLSSSLMFTILCAICVHSITVTFVAYPSILGMKTRECSLCGIGVGNGVLVPPR
ncbi:hypothetical protein JHK86_010086 [Glycine max]|nr:hypothetical protein JHK86_010086 [Glycine max]